MKLMARLSNRTGWDIRESALAAAIREARASGRELADLTQSNPTRCGFHYDTDATLAPLQNPAAMTYDPDPRGIRSAREAVGLYYADHGAEVDPERVILATSTSEAYGFLFRLLCNAGDEVLVAQPSYPLFDFLADLEDVRLRPYPLFWDFGWWIDFAALELAITPRTRAILLVHPNNPTGHATQRAERERLEAICLKHALALIVDEVFLDYGVDAPVETFATGTHPVLTFIVSGLSKICGLPQMKAAWIAAFGPVNPRNEALARLEIVADTFLSMNAPVQLAMPAWLAGREAIQSQIAARVRQNLEVLKGAAGVGVLGVEAGWAAVLRVPWCESGEALTLGFVARGVIVHPGSFYGMSEKNRIVVSLIAPEGEFRRGLEALVTR
jgi:alanine-synthesizing transaminase